MSRLTYALAAALLAVVALGAGCNVISPGLLGDDSGDDAATDAPPGETPDARADAGPAIPNLRVRYAFEEDAGMTVNDSTDHGLHAQLSDPAMWFATGRNGRGVNMNGQIPATQYINLPNGLVENVDDFTITAWIKMASNPVWNRIYDIGNGLPDPANRFMYLTPNGFSGETADGLHGSSYGGTTTNESIIATSTYLPINVWKHVAITGAGGQRKLYVDGFPVAVVDDGPAVAPREMEPIAPNSWIGRSRFAADAGFNGVMDEFRIYDRVLTQQEIADLAWPQQDYSYWRFDEGTAALAADSSDRGGDAALSNGAGWGTGRLGGAVTLGGGPASALGPHVVIANNPIAGCTTQMTISVWVRQDEIVDGAELIDLGHDDTHRLHITTTDGTGMVVGLTAPGETFTMTTPTPPLPADSLWHHVAVTMDGGGVVVLYVDGEPIRTQPSTIRPSELADLDEGYLGRSRTGGDYFHGALDELRIGCRNLTADEITGLAQR